MKGKRRRILFHSLSIWSRKGNFIDTRAQLIRIVLYVHKLVYIRQLECVSVCANFEWVTVLFFAPIFFHFQSVLLLILVDNFSFYSFVYAYFLLSSTQ